MPFIEMPFIEMPFIEMPFIEMPFIEMPLSAITAWSVVLVGVSGADTQPASNTVGAQIFRIRLTFASVLICTSGRPSCSVFVVVIPDDAPSCAPDQRSMSGRKAYTA
jgi:hypothetical protein